MAIKVIYTNAYGDSVEFSANSGIRITSIDGLTSNEINLSESTVNNQWVLLSQVNLCKLRTLL